MDSSLEFNKSIGDKEVLSSKYDKMGKGMRLFEAVIKKSKKSMWKMAYYGAYYSINKNKLTQDSLTLVSDPQDEVLLEAWNYPNVK